MPRRFALWYVVPVVAILLAVVAPLVLGQKTLILRDVLNAHYEMKWVQAEALRQGYVPLIDAARFGGQALLGNPNAAALYPDGLLLLVASPLWMLNAHFWLHLLLAPFCVYWMGRAWGLGRRGSWAAGVCYVASGFYLSNLNLYNLMAGITLAPALVAAALDLTAERRRGWAFAAVGGSWALLLVGGDPMTAALAAFLAASAVIVRSGLRGRGWLPLGGAFGLGTLIAAPQLVEFLRILPQSFRGFWRYSEKAATIGSWNPITVIDWLIPMAFGRADMSYWGSPYLAGEQPLYFSLAPGALAIALVVAAGRPRSRAAVWGWGMVAVGLVVALGRFNPLAGSLLQSVGGGLLRFPIKAWPLVAIGASLLCGLGFDRWVRGCGRRAVAAALWALAAFYLAAWLLLQSRGAPGVVWMSQLLAPDTAAGLVERVRLSWSGVALLTFLALLPMLLLVSLSRRRPVLAALALALHLALQLLLLWTLLPTDDAAYYRREPAVAATIPKGAVMVNGDSTDLFGPVEKPPREFPDTRVIWPQRRAWEAFYPFSAIRWGRRAEFAISPEGLDTFVARAALQAVQGLPDATRLRLLRTSGVEYLILGRQLPAELVDAVGWTALGTVAVGDDRHHVYRSNARFGDAWLVGGIEWAVNLNQALAQLSDPTFDAGRTVVLAGEGSPVEGPGGSVKIVSHGPERMVVETESAAPGVLMTRRAFLPIYRVRVSGERVRPVVGNLYRLAVQVPPGSHRVEIETDRRALGVSSAVAVLALAALVAIAWRWREKAWGSREPGAAPPD